MPIDTWVAGEPQQVAALASALRSSVAGALADHQDVLRRPRNAYRDVWQGPAGVALADRASNAIDDVDRLRSAFRSTGAAVERFGEELRIVQDSLESCRMDAVTQGLTVDGYLIEDVPPLIPMAYSPDGPVPHSVKMAEHDHRLRVEAFHSIADRADDAISRYVDACQDLTDTIGAMVDESWLADLVVRATLGALTYVGDDVLTPLAGRLDRSRALSSLLQGLDGNATGNLVRHLFGSVNGLSDGAVVSRLADLSTKSGGALDKYLLAAGVLAGLGQGESLEQAIVSEVGGLAAGVTVTTMSTKALALAWGSWAAATGSTVGPWGTVIIGGLGLAAGTGVGMFASNEIDDWYDDQEFEELIRKGLAEQEASR